MKKIVFLVMVLAAGSAFAMSFDAAGYEPAGLDELDKRKGGFKTTLVNPGVDFSRYTKIHQRKVVLVIDTSGKAVNDFETGRLFTKRERETVVPEFDEIVEFKRIVSDAITEELGHLDGVDQVESEGPGTLIIQPVITEVEISSSSKNRSSEGRELPVLKEGMIVFDLLDAESGEIVARFAESRRCKAPKGAKKAAGAWPNLPFWAEGAAADLRQELAREQIAGADPEQS